MYSPRSRSSVSIPLSPAIAEIHERLAQQASKQFRRSTIDTSASEAAENDSAIANSQFAPQRVPAIVKQFSSSSTPESAKVPRTPGSTKAAIKFTFPAVQENEQENNEPIIQASEASIHDVPKMSSVLEEAEQEITSKRLTVSLSLTSQGSEASASSTAWSASNASARSASIALVSDDSVDHVDTDFEADETETELDTENEFDGEFDETAFDENAEPFSPTPMQRRSFDVEESELRPPQVHEELSRLGQSQAQDAEDFVRGIVYRMLDGAYQLTQEREKIRLAFYPCIELVSSEHKLASSLQRFKDFWLSAYPAMEKQCGLSKTDLQCIIPRQIHDILSLHKSISDRLSESSPVLADHLRAAERDGSLKLNAGFAMDFATLCLVIRSLCSAFRSYLPSFQLYHHYQYEAKDCCDAEAKLQSHNKRYRLAMLSHIALDNGKNLSHYLSQPWQRMSRYEMLFKTIRDKFQSALNCGQHQTAGQAELAMLSGLVDDLVQLNQRINVQGTVYELKNRIKDLAFSLVDINRELLREDAVKQIQPKKKKMLLLLFNDGLLLLNEELRTKGWIKLSEMELAGEAELSDKAKSNDCLVLHFHVDSSASAGPNTIGGKRSLKRFSFKTHFSSQSQPTTLVYEFKFSSAENRKAWAKMMRNAKEKSAINIGSAAAAAPATPIKSQQASAASFIAQTPSPAQAKAGGAPPPLLSSLFHSSGSDSARSIPTLQRSKAVQQLIVPAAAVQSQPRALNLKPLGTSKGVHIFPPSAPSFASDFSDFSGSSSSGGSSSLISLSHYFDQVRRASISSNRLSLSMNAISRGLSIEDVEAREELAQFESQLDGMIELELELKFDQICKQAEATRKKSMIKNGAKINANGTPIGANNTSKKA